MYSPHRAKKCKGIPLRSQASNLATASRREHVAKGQRMITIVLAIITLLVALYLFASKPNRHMVELAERLPGPKCLPLVGTALELGITNKDMIYNLARLNEQFKPVFRMWIGPYLGILLTEPEHIEVLLSSTKHIEKAYNYNFARPWLGQGLLTGTGERWHRHRKLITPAFHFRILAEFAPVFASNVQVLVERLAVHDGGPPFDIHEYTKLCTLDVICEAVMGVKMNAQVNSSSEYVRAVESQSDVVMQMSKKPWLLIKQIRWLLGVTKLEENNLRILHGMTRAVIEKRKRQLQLNDKDKQKGDTEEKKQLCFLDLLIQASEDGQHLSDEEVQEEVDTIMFAGHDTTSSAINFACYRLAKHQDIQDKVMAELEEIFGDSDRPATFRDLQEMKYLERVIKETLRLYSSAPFFGRRLSEDIDIGGYTLPAGANVGFMPHITHRHPKYFPNPEKFDPDRFLPENCAGRHPYCYIPFSAGPRNCIGQKFAMLEMKATLSLLLRRYHFSGVDLEEPHLIPELVLRSYNGIRVQIKRRKLASG